MTAKKIDDLDPAAVDAEPCPWRCVGTPNAPRVLRISKPDDQQRGKTWVYCPKCSGSGPAADNPRDAVTLWNARRS